MAAPVAGTLSDRIGWRPLAAVGLALQAAGLAWIAALAGAHAAYGRDVVPFVLAGVGVSMAIPSTSSPALGAVRPELIGRASGVANTVQRFGAVFGIGIATAVFDANGSLLSRATATAGYRPALAVAAGFSVVGAAAALVLRAARRPAVATATPSLVTAAVATAAPSLVTAAVATATPHPRDPRRQPSPRHPGCHRHHGARRSETGTLPAVTEHFDVLIVGAGISGLGAACHLQERCPGKSFVLLEAQETFGGTWWTHRYPGVRSDSDLFTFGYRFKPWNGAPLASGAEILAYLNEVIDEHGLSGSIRYRHCVESAAWSTEDRRWRLTVRRVDTGEELRFTAGFLWMCQGYYRHDRPHTPAWAGLDRYQGTVVHPQHWPDGLDYGGKRVVVIGSGATAATLIPALAAGAGHVTMLQRSPTFFLPQPNVEELAETLRDLDVPDEWTHEILRRRHIKELTTLARMSAESPDALRKYLLEEIRSLLPEGFDVERHFTPSYRPWQQRIAVVPDGDLFAAIREGRVSVVTDRIDHFTPTGIRLASGEEVEADIVVTATGFDLSVLGDLPVVVDGRQVDFAEAVTYLGIMFTGVPNLASVFGYFRFSWTLRADLVSEFVCRLLRHMDDRGAGVVVPRLRPGEGDMPLGPWFDPEDFNPGYVMRSLDRLPRQGDRLPWRLGQDYLVERDLFPAVDLDDGALAFA